MSSVRPRRQTAYLCLTRGASLPNLQYHGNCDTGPECRLSHDLDLILTCHENPGKWKKQRKDAGQEAALKVEGALREKGLDGSHGNQKFLQADLDRNGTGAGSTKMSRSMKRRQRRKLKGAGAEPGVC